MDSLSEEQEIAQQLRTSLALAMKVCGAALIEPLLQQAHREQKVFFLKQVGMSFFARVLPQQAIEEYPQAEVKAELVKPYPANQVRILLHQGEDVVVGAFSIPQQGSRSENSSEIASSKTLN